MTGQQSSVQPRSRVHGAANCLKARSAVR